MPGPATAERAALADLDKLSSDLRAGYGHRQAHTARLDQIDGMIANLRNAVAQLPDEEIREAEFEDRLLARHDAGEFDWRAEPADHAARPRGGIEPPKAAATLARPAP